jgi:hypothetical protein
MTLTIPITAGQTSPQRPRHLAPRRGNLAPLPGPDHRLVQQASVTLFTWKIFPSIPETVPDGRSGAGFFGNEPPFPPNFSNIFDGLDKNVYPTDPFKKP